LRAVRPRSEVGKTRSRNVTPAGPKKSSESVEEAGLSIGAAKEDLPALLSMLANEEPVLELPKDEAGDVDGVESGDSDRSEDRVSITAIDDTESREGANRERFVSFTHLPTFNAEIEGIFSLPMSGTPLSPDVQGAEIGVCSIQGSARLGSPIKSEAGAVLAQGAHIRDIVCIDCHMVLM